MRSLFAHTLLECWKETRHPLSCKKGFYEAESPSPTAVPEIVIIKSAKRCLTQKKNCWYDLWHTEWTQSKHTENPQVCQELCGRSSTILSSDTASAQVVQGVETPVFSEYKGDSVFSKYLWQLLLGGGYWGCGNMYLRKKLRTTENNGQAATTMGQEPTNLGMSLYGYSWL